MALPVQLLDCSSGLEQFLIHRLLTLLGLMAGLAFMAPLQAAAAASPTVTRQKRPRHDGVSSSGSMDQQVKQLTAQMQVLMKVVNQHDRELREMEAWSCRTFLLNKESALAKLLLEAMQTWKSRVPETGPHPLGAPRWTVAGTVAQALLQDTTLADKLGKFRIFHEALTDLPDMERSVQLAMTKETRDHKVLLKIRPQLQSQDEWNEAFSVLSESVLKNGGEVKTSAAPPSPLIRQLFSK